MSPRHRHVLVAGLFGSYLLLALLVAVHSPVDAADQALFRWTRRHRVDWLVSLCRDVNDVLSPRTDVTILAILAAVVARRLRSWRPVGESARILVLLGIVVEGSKIAIGRPGPGDLASHEVQGAFPSGHSAALLVSGAVVLLLLRLDRLRPARLVLGGFTALLLVTLIYAHFHFISDIVGSWLAGAAILLALGPRVRRVVRPSGAQSPATSGRGPRTPRPPSRKGS